MKKFSTFFNCLGITFLFLLSCNLVFSQGIWETKSTPAEAVLHDIFFSDPNNGWICGENSLIAHTSDGGETWTLQDAGVSETINGLYFVTANKGWAAGGHGSILYTENGGNTWTVQEKKPTYLLDVQFIDENTGWIFAGEGHIYHTTNGGETWTEQATGQWADFNAGQMINDQSGVAVGYSGFIVYTTNGGQTWTDASSGTGNNLSGVSFVDENNGWAVGEEILLKTTNGGKNWTKQKDFPDEHLRAVYFKNPMEGWAASYYLKSSSEHGKIFYTSDGGENWVIQDDNPSTVGFNAISYVDDQNIWAAGDNNGVVAKMISNGQSEIVLQENMLPMPKGLVAESGLGSAVALSGNMVAVAEPNNGAGFFHVYKKMGSNWELIGDPVGIPWADPGLDALASSIDISGSKIITGSYAAGMGFEGKAAIWNIENDSVKLEGILEAPVDDKFVFAFYGYSVGISGYMAVVGSRNGGALGGSVYLYEEMYDGNSDSWSWQMTDKISASDAIPGEFFGHSVAISGQRFIVGAPHDSLSDSPNAGSVYVFERDGNWNWTQTAKLSAEFPTPSGNFGHAVDLDGDYAVVAELNEGNGKAYIFHYNGTTWDLEKTVSDFAVVNDNGNVFIGGLSVSVSGTKVVVGADNTDGTGSAVLYTKSNEEWIGKPLMVDGLNEGDGFGFSVSVSGNSVAVGAPRLGMGAAYIFEPTSIPTAITADKFLTDHFELYQNYPNPFHQTTVIGFNLEKPSHVNLAIYDIQGREVMKLIDENFSAGIHQKVFNASNLTEGIYFYKMRANGTTQTKKLVSTK